MAEKVFTFRETGRDAASDILSSEIVGMPDGEIGTNFRLCLPDLVTVRMITGDSQGEDRQYRIPADTELPTYSVFQRGRA